MPLFKLPVRALLFLLATAAPLAAQSHRLGTIAFPNSGPKAAQRPFIRGVLLLHSFEYKDAAAAFREAQHLAPGFALAYWGGLARAATAAGDAPVAEQARADLRAIWHQADEDLPGLAEIPRPSAQAR